MPLANASISLLWSGHVVSLKRNGKVFVMCLNENIRGKQSGP